MMPFEANIYSNLAPDRAIRLWCVGYLVEGLYAVWLMEGIDSFTSEHFHPMIVAESFRLLNVIIQHHATYLLHNLPQISSRMVIQFLVKISHITMDFVPSLASDRVVLGPGPQLCITWI